MKMNVIGLERANDRELSPVISAILIAAGHVPVELAIVVDEMAFPPRNGSLRPHW